MDQTKRFSVIIIGVLLIFHFVGIWGMSNTEMRPLFQLLTPFNLLFSTLLIGISHKAYSYKFIYACLIIFLGGYGVEVLGVHTGVLFGEYTYGKTLGFKIAEVPLAMGLNWLLLIYSIGSLFSQLNIPAWGKPILGASLMVILDIIIEPVAIKLDFWTWTHTVIPIRNFIAWFIFSWFFFWLFLRLLPNHKSVVGVGYIFIQFLFFGMLLLLL